MGNLTAEIRAFLAGDVAAAAGMERTHQPSPWSEKMFRDELSAERRCYLAAVTDHLVGYGGVMAIGEEAHVNNLFVTPDQRRLGVGGRLLSSLMVSAVELGATRATLEVRMSNAPAIALYSGVGFAPVGVRPGYYGDDDALIMWAYDINSIVPEGSTL